MSTNPPPNAADQSAALDERASGWRERASVTALVFLSLFLFAAVRSPVPGINEPHYLSKARHYWNPEWCSGDFFLESANAHLVFYQAVGWLTRWFSLEQTAWFARGFAFLLLAAGWTRFVSRLVPGRWSSLRAVWVYLALAAVADWSSGWFIGGVSLKIFDLSGEWIVRGVEGKVFAYAFALWGLAWVMEGKWNRAAVTLGLAVSFHPVVGVWSVAAVVLAVVAQWLVSPVKTSDLASARRMDFQSVRDHTDGLETHPTALEQFLSNCRRVEAGPRVASRLCRPIVLRLLVPVGLFILASLPGLLPALTLIGDDDSQTVLIANFIQVAFRLPHHLDPNRFPLSAYIAHLVLLAVWWIGRRRVEFSRHEPFFAWFIGATLLIAIAGLAFGWGPRPLAETPLDAPFLEWRLRLLKFYPFRLFDAMAPVAVALTAAAWSRHPGRTWGRLLACPWKTKPVGSSAALHAREDTAKAKSESTPESVATDRLEAYPTFWFFAGAFLLALLMPSVSRKPSQMSAARLADWLDVCRWAAAETPASAHFITPNESWAFKWYAQRAEFVAFKDCPQDAAGIVEWNRRLVFEQKWFRENYADALYSTAELRKLHEETGVTHLIVRRLGPFEIEPVFQNGSFKVYDLERVE